jgi:ribosome-binding protein aMBF1 (putative translation factor)
LCGLHGWPWDSFRCLRAGKETRETLPNNRAVPRAAAQPQVPRAGERGAMEDVAMTVTEAAAYHARFGERLRRARRHVGISQQSLADALGRSRGFIAHLESGKDRALAVDVVALAGALSVSPLYLLTGESRDV